MKRPFWNSEKIISFSAIFISLLTLVVFVYQTNIIREQQRLSVLPYLQIGNYENARPNYKLVISNDGIGPAFIESVVTIRNGERFDVDLPRFLGQHIPEVDTIEDVFHSNIAPGQLIPAGAKIAILEVNNNLESAIQLYKILSDNDISIELIYASAYGEKWKLNSNENAPERIN